MVQSTSPRVARFSWVSSVTFKWAFMSAFYELCNLSRKILNAVLTHWSSSTLGATAKHRLWKSCAVMEVRTYKVEKLLRDVHWLFCHHCLHWQNGRCEYPARGMNVSHTGCNSSSQWVTIFILTNGDPLKILSQIQPSKHPPPQSREKSPSFYKRQKKKKSFLLPLKQKVT